MMKNLDYQAQLSRCLGYDGENDSFNEIITYLDFNYAGNP
jgi:hypothetical protein